MDIEKLEVEIVEVLCPKYIENLYKDFTSLDQYTYFYTSNFISRYKTTYIITEIHFNHLKSVLQGGDNGFALQFILEKKENQIEISMCLMRSTCENVYENKIIINDNNYRILIDNALEEYLLKSKILVNDYLSKTPDDKYI